MVISKKRKYEKTSPYFVNFLPLHGVGDFESGVLELQGPELTLDLFQAIDSPVLFCSVDGLQPGNVM